MIFFKGGQSQEKEFWGISPKMQMIVTDAAYYIKVKFNVNFVVTSIIRSDGIHACGRALDARSSYLEPEQIAKVDHYINEKYPYGKGGYKTCWYHKVDNVADSEYHFHFQCKYEPNIHPK